MQVMQERQKTENNIFFILCYFGLHIIIFL